jgi:hypothetical protein
MLPSTAIKGNGSLSFEHLGLNEDSSFSYSLPKMEGKKRHSSRTVGSLFSQAGNSCSNFDISDGSSSISIGENSSNFSKLHFDSRYTAGMGNEDQFLFKEDISFELEQDSTGIFPSTEKSKFKEANSAISHSINDSHQQQQQQHSILDTIDNIRDAMKSSSSDEGSFIGTSMAIGASTSNTSSIQMPNNLAEKIRLLEAELRKREQTIGRQAQRLAQLESSIRLEQENLARNFEDKLLEAERKFKEERKKFKWEIEKYRALAARNSPVLAYNASEVEQLRKSHSSGSLNEQCLTVSKFDWSAFKPTRLEYCQAIGAQPAEDAQTFTRRYPDGTCFTVHKADAKVEERYPDGVHIQRFSNGDIRKDEPGGNYYYSNKRDRTNLFHDATSKVTALEDCGRGERRIFWADGSVQVNYADGRIEFLNKQ